MVPSLLSESDATKRAEGWNELLKSPSSKFGSAAGTGQLRTFPVSLNMLDDRTGGDVTPASLGLAADASGTGGSVSLDDFKYATIGVTLGSGFLGILALAFLPPNIGPTVCYLLALMPILFIGIGSSAPGIIADAIARVKNRDDESTQISKRQRRCRHEAAHLCCGYWCGLPVSEYAVGDGADGARVEFEVQPETGRGYSAAQVAALAVTGLAGSVGEIAEWKRTDGSAAQDLSQLDLVYRNGAEFYGAQQQQDLTRWAALTAWQQLKQNRGSYESVVQAIERQAPLEECIAILEG